MTHLEKGQRVSDYERPDPDALLKVVKNDQDQPYRGKLKIFFGYAAGVGKTFTMLSAAHEGLRNGVDVVVGYIEPHTRPETLALLKGLEVLPTKLIDYRGIQLKEFDLDRALERRPELILVDELAHTNAEGNRHQKRFQDVEELLRQGIDVYTTVNVQHIESLNDMVAGITHTLVRETIDDFLFDHADEIELIDIEPEALLKRFAEGKIYTTERASVAQEHFFVKSNLNALREMALRRTAERVNKEKEMSRLKESGSRNAATDEMLLVNVSPASASATVIRSASRLADIYYGKWYAIYVETSTRKQMDVKRKAQMEANLDLAKRLGAEVIILESDYVAKALIDFAKAKGISRIVVEKQKGKLLKSILGWRRSTADWLIRLTENDHIDIHMIRIEAPEQPNPFVMYDKGLKWFKFSGKDLGKTGMIMVLTCALTLAFRQMGLPETDIILTFLVGVLAVSMATQGYLMGMLASIMTLLLYNFFFTEPYFSLNVANSGDILTFPFILIVALSTSTLMSRIQTQADLAMKKEQRTQILYEMARGIIRKSSVDEILLEGIRNITKLVELPVVAYLPNANGQVKPYETDGLHGGYDLNRLSESSEKAVAQWVYQNGKVAGKHTSTLPGASGYYLPISGQSGVYGVIGIDCSVRVLSEEQKSLTDAMLAQIGIAIEQDVLVTQQSQAKLEIDKERFRSTLLRSLSHDLRTPLTSIVGASSTLTEKGNLISETMKERLLKDIFEDAMWLTRMVDNLLSLTRLEEGNVKLKLEMNTADEIIEMAVYRMKRVTSRHQVSVKLPSEVLSAPMESNLMTQVLINLLDNAVKFTPSQGQIDISSYAQDNRLYFEVKDSGKGIPLSDQTAIFNLFYSSESRSGGERRGMGLGLAICKAIVEAHQGEIVATSPKSGGALIKLWIPMVKGVS